MRVATFNVLHGRSLLDERVDLDRYADAVRDLDVDVLALQEVDRDQPRSHGADLVALAAEAMGAAHARFAATLAGLPDAWTRAGGHELPGTPLYGVGLVSRWPVTAWRVVRLPALPGIVPVLFPGRRRPSLVRDEPRTAVVGRVEAPTGPVTVVSTHLSFVPRWNRAQLRRLVRALAGDDPLVLMGDLNLEPEPVAAVSGLRPVAAAPTFPAAAPVVQLDHVLVRGALRATAAGSRHLPLSDHRALRAELVPA